MREFCPLIVRRLVAAPLAGLAMLMAAAPGMAIDPPYQQQMERLIEVLGSLYFLQPICGMDEENWRDQAGELIALDNPEADRRERLTGAFNAGYENYARLYRSCTPHAKAAMERLLVEAESNARDIHTRFAE